MLDDIIKISVEVQPADPKGVAAMMKATDRTVVRLEGKADKRDLARPAQTKEMMQTMAYLQSRIEYRKQISPELEEQLTTGRIASRQKMTIYTGLDVGSSSSKIVGSSLAVVHPL